MNASTVHVHDSVAINMWSEDPPPIDVETPTNLKVHYKAKTNVFRLDGGKVNVQEIAKFFKLDASTMLVRRGQSDDDDDDGWEKFGADRSTGLSLESFADAREVWVKIDHPNPLDYTREHEKFNLRILQFFDVCIELANESSDVVFAFLVLKGEAPGLFWASCSFLLLSLIVRSYLGLQARFEPQKGFKTPPIDPKKMVQYWGGVLLSLVEPMSGLEVIHDARLDMSDEENIKKQKKKEDLMEFIPEDLQRAAAIDTMGRALEYDDAKKRRTIIITMLFLEDIPELIIDLLFIYLYGDGIGDVTLFVVSLVLTALHMFRTCADLWFQYKNIHCIPRILILESKEDAQLKLDESKPSTITHIFAFSVDLSATTLQTFLQKQRKSLQFFMTQTCQLGDGAGIEIAKALKTSTTLEKLDLGTNKLGDEAGIAISKALETNSTLNLLALRNNELGEEAGIAIGKALETNSTLKKLNLWDNQLGDQAGIAIGKALKTNSTLTSLDLENNKLGDEAGKAIGKALETNSTLTSLNLGDNKLSQSTKKSIESTARSGLVVHC